jgi:hypothetical protein
VIANGENAAGGIGITEKTADDMYHRRVPVRATLTRPDPTAPDA